MRSRGSINLSGDLDEAFDFKACDDDLTAIAIALTVSDRGTVHALHSTSRDRRVHFKASSIEIGSWNRSQGSSKVEPFGLLLDGRIRVSSTTEPASTSKFSSTDERLAASRAA